MSKRYIILSAILLLLGIGLVFLPTREKAKELSPNELLLAIDDPSRFLEADPVTDRIITKDPSLLLVDVRPAVQFKQYNIPTSTNIPIDSILGNSFQELLRSGNKDVVFVSNDDMLADQAWQLCKRMKLNNIYVLKGGINLWFQSIMVETPPVSTDDRIAIDQYAFRKAARQYFTKEETTPPGSTGKNSATDSKEPIKLEKKTTTKSSGGGC